MTPPPPAAVSGADAVGLSAGPIDWRLGVEYVLLALRRLADAGVHAAWEVVGDGPERERLAFTASDLGLADRVRVGDGPLEGRPRPAWVLLGTLRPRGEEEDRALRLADAGAAVVCPTAAGFTAAEGWQGFAPRDPESLADAIRRAVAAAVARG